MTTPATRAERPHRSRAVLARWRCWLFNRIARWEEASLARSLGLPADQLFLVDLSDDERDPQR